MNQKLRNQTTVRGFVLIIVITVVATSCVDRAREAELQNEWSQIQVPSGVTVLDRKGAARMTTGFAGAYFKSDSPLEEIRRFYEAELLSHGWTFRGEGPVKKRGRNVGDHEFVFCKGTLAAVLYFPGPKSAYISTYVFDMSWGSNRCEKPERKD
jgi:hypothetical protein